MPAAAMEAIEHVEKVRINPGNFVDKKRFAVRDYSDQEYQDELQRVANRFLPLVRRAKILGRSLRIGTNHGSLSDRIMNRFGDSPAGMVESAMEFILLAESEGYHDLIISMKSSNPKIMVAAYRLLVARLAEHGQAYPLRSRRHRSCMMVRMAGSRALPVSARYSRMASAIPFASKKPDPSRQNSKSRLLDNWPHVIAPWRTIPPPGQCPEEVINPYLYQRRVATIVRVADPRKVDAAVTPGVAIGGGLIPRVLVPRRLWSPGTALGTRGRCSRLTITISGSCEHAAFLAPKGARRI